MSTTKSLTDIYTDDIFDYLNLEHCHMGYWPDHCRDFAQAQEHTLEYLAKPLNLNSSSVVLDIAGGQGGTAIWLARKYGCKVVVVDIVPSMVNRGEEKVKQAGLSDQISLVCSDILDYDANGRFFDAIISVESLQHVKNTTKLFEKIDQLLKPCGVLGASIYLDNSQKKWFQTYLDLTVGDRDLPAESAYQSHLESYQFSSYSIEDITQKTLKKSSNALYSPRFFKRILEYHIDKYGRIPTHLCRPLFRLINSWVMHNELLQLKIIRGTKSII